MLLQCLQRCNWSLLTVPVPWNSALIQPLDHNLVLASIEEGFEFFIVYESVHRKLPSEHATQRRQLALNNI